MADAPRRTPLYDRHVEAGARIVDFAGWEMPVQYEGIRQEHEAVRTAVGLFDVSHMGEVEVAGPQAGELVQRLLSNDLAKLDLGGAQYSVLCNEEGGVLDDCFAYRVADDRYLIVTNASNHERDFAWMRDHAAGFDAEVIDAADRWAMIAVQGPAARETLAARLAHLERHVREVGPAARRVPLVARRAYEEGEQGIVALLDAHQAALEAEAQAIRLRGAAWSAQLELDRVTGLSIPPFDARRSAR